MSSLNNNLSWSSSWYQQNNGGGSGEDIRRNPDDMTNSSSTNTKDTNFNWGAGMAALQTINANYTTLTSLSSGDDKNKLINQAAIDAGQSGVIKEVGGTPMSLQAALQTVANNPELKAFLEHRDSGTINNRYSQGELGDAISQLNIMEGTYNAAQISLNTGINIDYGKGLTGDSKDNALQMYTTQYFQKYDKNGDGKLDAQEDPNMIVFDKTGLGGNNDGAMGTTELKNAFDKLDTNQDGTIDTTEQQTLANLKNGFNLIN